MSDKAGNGDADPSDQEIETGIDAINLLRMTMRKAGMWDCADALDEAFVKCLKDYMARKDATGTSEMGSDKPETDLN